MAVITRIDLDTVHRLRVAASAAARRRQCEGRARLRGRTRPPEGLHTSVAARVAAVRRAKEADGERDLSPERLREVLP